MERPQHGERRSPQSGTKYSHRADCRSRRGGGPLHADQRGGAVRASGGQHRSVSRSELRREVHNPGRNIPIALIAGVGVVAVLYMLTNAAVQYVLPAASIAASPRPASEATAVAAGAWGAAVVSAGMALSMLVALNGTIMSGARVALAMAGAGYFFQIR